MQDYRPSPPLSPLSAPCSAKPLQEGLAQPCTKSFQPSRPAESRESCSLPATHKTPHPPPQGSKPRCILLSLEAVVAPQELLVLLVCTELNGSIRDHAHHGGRVPPPEAPEALVEVGVINQPVGFLQATEQRSDGTS